MEPSRMNVYLYDRGCPKVIPPLGSVMIIDGDRRSLSLETSRRGSLAQ